METGNGYEGAKAVLERARSAPWYRQVKQQRDDLFGTLETPEQLRRSTHRWFQQEAVYDPTVALRKLRVPSLFLFGDDDDTIPVSESVRIIRETLTQSGAHDFTIREFPKTDHGMFVLDAGGGRVRSDDYLKSMSDWLTAHHFSSAGR
jgi:pimeloyl-ACP methyl ester carboxylesterase